MNPEASAQQSPSDRVRKTRWRLRGVLLAALAAWFAVGVWQVRKPLPPGVRTASAWAAVPADHVRLLFDTTTADAYGRPVVEQQIFDEVLRMIGQAHRLLVLDLFLFNNQRGANEDAPLRPLSRELTEALLAARRARPDLRMLLITDPINDMYGGNPSAELAALRLAGIDVITTDLDQLRDSNPVYSALWRLGIDWWGGDGRGTGWLPNPLDAGPTRVTFRAWARLLNFKANHRKVVIADDGAGKLIGIVTSANPHDASSAHSNVALQVRGDALRSLFQSEIRIARFSGWRGLPILLPAPVPAPIGAATQGAAPVRVRSITEGAIRDAILERVLAARPREHIDFAMFYLADRDIVDALIDASRRGVEIRLLLDPNKDAFGYSKSGIPNRPAASELVSRSDGAIKVRWYRTHGEQFHTKLVAVRSADRLWLTAGSANLTRRNIGDYNLEANLAIDAERSSRLATDYERWFETLWNNRGPTGVEYTADFATFADPAQSSYWAYRIMEATGLSTF